MADLSNPSPLVMTPYEAIAFFAAVAVLALTILRDLWRRRGKR